MTGYSLNHTYLTIIILWVLAIALGDCTCRQMDDEVATIINDSEEMIRPLP